MQIIMLHNSLPSCIFFCATTQNAQATTTTCLSAFFFLVCTFLAVRFICMPTKKTYHSGHVADANNYASQFLALIHFFCATTQHAQATTTTCLQHVLHSSLFVYFLYRNLLWANVCTADMDGHSRAPRRRAAKSA